MDFYKFYIQFMVWLGAAPPKQYEYLLSNIEKVNEPSAWRHISKKYKLIVWLISVLIAVCLVCVGLSSWPTFLPWLQSSTLKPIIFPTNQQIINNHGIGLFVGPLLLCTGIVFLLWLLYQQRRGRINLVPRIFLFAPIMIIIGAAFSFDVYYRVTEALLFRFNVTQITEIQIERLGDDKKCFVNQSMIIKDKALIVEGFKQLETAQRFNLAHEGLIEGYQIRLIFDSFSLHYRYLSVYKRSDKGREIDAIVPHIFPNIDMTETMYKSPEFYFWVSKNIEPMFKGC